MADYQEAIKPAIAAAIQERSHLLDKLKEFDKIRERLGQIEAFINQGRLLIGEEPERTPIGKPETKAGEILRWIRETKETKRNFEKIVEIMKATGRAMTVPQIVDEFKARNWQLGEKNRTQIIRNALKSKDGVLFKKVAIGLWDLMERAA